MSLHRRCVKRSSHLTVYQEKEKIKSKVPSQWDITGVLKVQRSDQRVDLTPTSHLYVHITPHFAQTYSTTKCEPIIWKNGPRWLRVAWLCDECNQTWLCLSSAKGIVNDDSSGKRHHIGLSPSTSSFATACFFERLLVANAFVTEKTHWCRRNSMFCC